MHQRGKPDGRYLSGDLCNSEWTAELVGRSDAGKPVTGDIVVLAVPYPALADVLAVHGDQLAEKVVVDITNPLDFQTFDSLTVPADSSAAAEIAAALPRARLCLAEIDRLMEDHRFLAADFVSLADLMVIPLLYYFSNVPDGRAPVAEHPKLQSWIRHMETRQAFQVTKPPPI